MKGFVENTWVKIKVATSISVVITAAWMAWAVGVEYQKITDQISVVDHAYANVVLDHDDIWESIKMNDNSIQAMQITQAEVKKDLEYIKALLLDIQKRI
jgi:peptidoglycan hydrolase CwlO-like protein